MFAIVLTRLDIAFTLRKLSQYISDLAEHYSYALKNLLQYLRLTVTIKLRYELERAYSRFVIYSNAN